MAVTKTAFSTIALIKALGGGSGGGTPVSGTTPVIEGEAGKRYVCGEVSTISITPPDSGIIDVVFVSGSTPAVLTVPATVKWNDDSFDPESLESDTVYELNIMDGTLGAVGTWTD